LMIIASSRRSALYRDPSLLWRDAASKAPNNARAVDGVGTVEMRLGPSHFATADSLLSRAIELDSTFVTARVRRAAIAVSESRLVDAETLLVHALRISPGDSAATDQLGLALLADGRPDSASVYLSNVARVFPSATTLAHAGMAHFEAGNLDSAVVLLQRAVRLDSARTDALFYLGAALVESARGGEAIPFLERESAIDPTRPLSLGVLAVAYAQGAQPDRARRAVEAAVERAPTNEALFVFAGRAMQTLHDFQAASRFFTHAVELSPNDPQAWTRLGVAEASLGNTSRAQVFLRRALSIEPRYGPVQAAIMSGVR